MRTTTDERRLRRWVAGTTLGLGSLALGACQIGATGPLGGGMGAGPGDDGGGTVTVPDEPGPPSIPGVPDGPAEPGPVEPEPTVPEAPDATVPDDEAPSATTVPAPGTSEPGPVPTTVPTESGDGLDRSTQLEMVALVNAQRASGRSCGSEGTFGPTTPLRLDLTLAEAAQAHAEDMAQNDRFSHTGTGGTSGADRIEAAGYDWRAWGENIAAGNPDAAATVAQWFASPTHCANFMKPVFTEVGFGYDQEPSSTFVHYWTANLGTPA